MSTRGDIIRGAGGHLKRNNDLGVGIGQPHGGDEGDIRVQMVDGSPKLYAKAGDQWYGINLTSSSSEGGVGDEFIIGGTADHIKITPENGLEVFNNYANVSKLGKTLRIGKVANDASRLEVDSSGNVSIINRQGTTDTTRIQLDANGDATFTGTVTVGSGSSFSGATWNGAAISTSLQTSGSDNTNFYQDGIPTSLKAGDLWFDTDDSHKAYRAASVGADAITGGEWVLVVTNSDNITAGTLDCSGITVSNLNAGSITAGNLSADRISGGTLTIGNISFSGAISATHGGTGLTSTSTLLNSNVTINANGTLSGAGSGTPALQSIGGAITAAQVNCTNIGLDGKIIITSTGDRNVIMGENNTDDGTDNVAFGNYALNACDTNATNNIAIGSDTLRVLDSVLSFAQDNIAIGVDSLSKVTAGRQNIAIGTEACKGIDSAPPGGGVRSYFNIAIGYHAMSEAVQYDGSTNPTYNIAIGVHAGGTITTGKNNVFIGNNSGNVTTTGTGNVCIGSGSRPAALDTDNSIHLGYNAYSAASETFAFGSATGRGVSDTFTNSGTCTFTFASDERRKQNINDAVIGLDFINELRPRTFTWRPPQEWPEEWQRYTRPDESEGPFEFIDIDTEKVMHGFIAQEGKEVLDKYGVTDTTNIWKEDSDGMQRFSEGKLVMPIVKAIQELSAKVTALEAQIN